MTAVESLRQERVARSLRLARLLDTSLRIPGTRIRFGLDPILSLVPGLGTASGALLGSYIVWTALRVGAPRIVIARMLGNIGLDAAIGAVPVAGAIFDVAFKAHRRNAQLLGAWSQTPAATVASQRRMALAVAATALALVAIAAATLVLGIWALLQLLG